MQNSTYIDIYRMDSIENEAKRNVVLDVHAKTEIGEDRPVKRAKLDEDEKNEQESEKENVSKGGDLGGQPELKAEDEGAGIGSDESEDEQENFDEEDEKTTPSTGHAEDGNTCAVCMEGQSEERQILSHHNCPQCAPDAWKICDLCDNHMISKICPICRGDYAPRVLHKVFGPALCSIMEKPPKLTAVELKQMVAKSAFIKKILGVFDVALMCPNEGVLLFAYPNQKSDELTTDEQPKASDPNTSICIAEIPMSKDKLVGDIFLLNNKVWDDLEKQIESGSECEILPPGQAFRKLFEATRRVDSVLLTSLIPGDFDEAISGMIAI